MDWTPQQSSRTVVRDAISYERAACSRPQRSIILRSPALVIRPIRRLVQAWPASRGETFVLAAMLMLLALSFLFDVAEQVFSTVEARGVERWQLDELLISLPALTLVFAMALRRRARAFALQDARFRVLVEHSSDVVSIFDADGAIRYVSPALIGLLDERPEDWIGRSPLDLAHPDDRARLQRGFLRLAAAPGGHETIELRLRHRMGGWREVEARGTNRLDDPAVGGIVVNVRDITARRAAESALRFSEGRYRDLFDNAPVMYAVTDEETGDPRIVACNRLFASTLGYTVEELIGQRLAPMYAEEDRAFLTSAIHLARIAEGALKAGERRLIARDGSVIDALMQLRPVLSADGSLTGAVAAYVDITSQKQALAALRTAERDYRELFELAGDAILIFDPDDETILDANARVRDLYGFRRDDFVGRSLRSLSAEPGRHHDHLQILMRDGRCPPFETVQRRADGTSLTLEINASRIVYGGRPAVLSINRDVTAHRALQAELAHRAFHDALTDLPNRALFADRLTHAMARAVRRNESIAVLMLDLDRFKLVNDSLGHAAGDLFLIAVARRLTSCLRESDTLARLGGDEFAVLLDQATVETALAIVDRVMAALSKPMMIDGREVYGATSIGVAVSTADDEPDELLRMADVALYQAKRAGRGMAVVVNHAESAMADDWLTLEVDLRRAIAAGELTLHYQPVVDLSDGRLEGVEALARWSHPTRGMVPPAEFIPLAEETGLITEITAWVIEESCRQLAEWRRELGPDAPARISLNLTARDLRNPAFVERLTRAFADARIPASGLQLEITERVLVEELEAEAAVTTLRAVRALGVSLAIDDFGAGASSLASLRAVDSEVLKLDRAFVQRLDSDADTRVVVGAITAMAHALRLRVTAEGIETEAQLDAVRAAGCDLGQGYLFSRPMPAGEIAAWVCERHASVALTA